MLLLLLRNARFTNKTWWWLALTMILWWLVGVRHFITHSLNFMDVNNDDDESGSFSSILAKLCAFSCRHERAHFSFCSAPRWRPAPSIHRSRYHFINNDDITFQLNYPRSAGLSLFSCLDDEFEFKFPPHCAVHIHHSHHQFVDGSIPRLIIKFEVY